MWGTSLLRNLFDQVDKIRFFISYCEDIILVSLIVKDYVIICEIIKWVFGTTLFGGDFQPLKPFWACKKKYMSLRFSSTTHM